MFRLLSGFVLLIMCVVFGAVQSAKYRSRSRTLTQLLEDITELELMLKYERRTIDTIAAALAAAGSGPTQAFWEGICQMLRKGCSFSAAWSASKLRLFQLRSGDMAIMDSLAEQLGTSDYESELKRIGAAKQRLATLEQKVRADTDSKAKLLGSLSVLGGLACVLLVI